LFELAKLPGINTVVQHSMAADYVAALDTVTALVLKAPDSYELNLIAARVALGARQRKRSLEFYEKALVNLNQRIRDELSSERSDDDTAEKEGHNNRRRQNYLAYNGLMHLGLQIASACAWPYVERLNGNEQVSAKVFSEALDPHRQILDLADVEWKRDVKVAILGGLPRRQSPGYSFKVTGRDSVSRDLEADALSDTLGLIIHTLSDRAELVFVPAELDSNIAKAMQVDDIVSAIDTAVGNGAKVILIPHLPSYQEAKSIYDKVAQVAEAGTTVVMPALTKGTISILKDKFHVNYPSGAVAFVANTGVDEYGFSKARLNIADGTRLQYLGALWAPGVGIPWLRADGTWQESNSAFFSAAAVAAVVANLFGAGFDGSPTQLIGILDATAVSHDPRNSDIRIISQRAALEVAVKGNPIRHSDTNDRGPSACDKVP
jgi:hypothetical protein